MTMKKTIFLLAAIFVFPTGSNVGKTLFLLHRADASALSMDHRFNGCSNDMAESDSVSHVLRLIGFFKSDKKSPSYAVCVVNSPRIRWDNKDIHPQKTVPERILSVYPNTVLRI